MEIGTRYHRLLINDVKRNTKTDGMGPFNMVSENRSGEDQGQG